MARVAIRLSCLLALFCAVLFVPGCARDQQLTSIAVTPNNQTITGQGLEVQFTAIGTYAHPSDTKDITSQVIWASSTNQIISFTSTPGLAISGQGCGTNLQISATYYTDANNHLAGSTIVGFGTVNVNQPGNPNCP